MLSKNIVGVAEVHAEGLPLISQTSINVSKGDVLANKMNCVESEHFRGHVRNHLLLHHFLDTFENCTIIWVLCDAVLVIRDYHVDFAVVAIQVLLLLAVLHDIVSDETWGPLLIYSFLQLWVINYRRCLRET